MQAGISPRIAGVGLHSTIFNKMRSNFLSPPLDGGSVSLFADFGGQDLERVNFLLERIYAIASSTAPRAIRRAQVLELTGIGKSHLYNMLDEESPAFDKTFPKPFRLGNSPNSPSVWWQHRVIEWLNSKARVEETESGDSTTRRQRCPIR